MERIVCAHRVHNENDQPEAILSYGGVRGRPKQATNGRVEIGH